MTQMQADRYIQQAVLKSSEGVVFFPAAKTAHEYDRMRLNEIAQSMRQPLAVCFLERAIQTIERGEVDGEQTYVNVPEGQGKFRARLAGDGSVARVETLDSGFEDPNMEDCILKVIGSRQFPQLRGQSQSYIDVVYWVSLGMHAGAHTPQFAKHMRREQATAGVRAKRCLEGRVDVGDYDVEGLSLFASNGTTLINRITRGGLPPEVSRCVAQAFKEIRIDPEKDSFVRPVSPRVLFTMREDGGIDVSDERWLQVIEMEEEAKREAKRYELSGGNEQEFIEPGTDSPHDVTISGVEPVPDEPQKTKATPTSAPLPEPTGPVPDAQPPPKAKDPSEGGMKLELGPRT